MNNVFDTLSCLYTNAYSLPNKFDELKNIITERYPLICGVSRVTEVKAKNFRYALNASEFNIEGYNVHGCNIKNDW